MTEIPAPPWGPTRKRAPRRVLSQDGIIAAALRIVDTEGIDAMSMRRVAQELGTGAASLYAHVAGRDELIALVLDRVRAEIHCPVPDPERWQEQVKDVMRQARAALAAHGDLARLSIEIGVPTGENAMRTAEGVLAILAAGRLPVQVCAYGVDALALYVTAAAAEEAALAFSTGVTTAGKDDFLAQVRDYYKSLPSGQFPVITGMVDELMRDVGDERFEFGLDLLVSGLARHAAPAAGE
ncbi:TetR/AcrR family transcriptional regulator [Streptomyces sp. NPDC087422]|uniref:TetR/AcrR family transcriptional regulator n=1 Tax=Streptomyces sp. NPDC087422 TaxID=3365786 RepID=UPI0037FD7F30